MDCLRPGIGLPMPVFLPLAKADNRLAMGLGFL